MAKPCAVFWDVQHVGVPKGQSHDSVVNLIRSDIIEPHNLNETFFFCVCDVNNLSVNIGQSLTALNVDIVQAYNGVKDSAGNKMMDLMREFVEVAGQDCTIILLSGNSGYYGTLSDLKKLHNISIHLIGPADSFSSKLDQIADYTFMLNDDVLKPIKSTQVKMGKPCAVFWDMQNVGVPRRHKIDQIITLIRSKIIEPYNLKQIFFFCVCDVHRLPEDNGQSLTAMNVAIVQDYNGVKHSAKIKIMDLIRKFVKVAGQGCTIILLTGDADYYDTLSEFKKLHNVSIHQIGMPNSFSFEIAQISDHTFMLNNGVLEPQNIVDIDDCGSYKRSIFFQFDSFDVPLFIWKDLTKWSVLYDLYEQLYDLGAKKVILAWQANAYPIYNTVFHRDLYCASFDSASAYRDAFEEIRLRNLKAYEFVNISESYKHEVAVKMSRYRTINRIPWCLNQELFLCCLKVEIESKFHNNFMEMSKKILGNRECIFIKCIKKTPGEIWIGFPNGLICKNSKKTVDGFIASLKQSSNVLVAKPSNDLLESINFQDLAGDAYDLAFLSSQLDGTQPSPNIIERISLQRMQEQECDEAVFFITIEGDFSNSRSWVRLRADQIIKIFVKFSKVIPLAAAIKSQVCLMFHSWYEAQVARHFLNNLTLSEVPYFKELSKVSEVNKQQFTSLNFMVFYIINDQRNVLEKIMQNRSLVHKLDFNSSIVQSTSEIDPADGQVANMLKYVFTITSSGFKFTRGMISIIKMHLVFMKCPAYIEFENKIWFGVDDLKKGNKIKNEFRFLTFKMLHEDDDYDQWLDVAVQSVASFPPKVGKMLADKLIDKKKPSASDDLIKSDLDLDLDTVPLGHFNYSYRKAVGMSIDEYIKLDNLGLP